MTITTITYLTKGKKTLKKGSRERSDETKKGTRVEAFPFSSLLQCVEVIRGVYGGNRTVIDGGDYLSHAFDSAIARGI